MENKFYLCWADGINDFVVEAENSAEAICIARKVNKNAEVDYEISWEEMRKSGLDLY